MVRNWIFACVAAVIWSGCSDGKGRNVEKDVKTETTTKTAKPSSPFGKISPSSKEVEILMPMEYPKGSPVDKWGKLKVAKNAEGARCLCDEKGNPVQLRGMSSHGMQWAGVANITEENIKSLAKDWKCNVFRLAFYVDEEGGYAYNPTHKTRHLENVAKWCAENGIYLLIDWHVHSPGNPQSAYYRKHPCCGVDLAADFFTYCSRRFQYQKHVIYELCNEPNSTKGEVTWLRHIKPYCEEMLKIIRENDHDVVCICGTPEWSQRPQDVIGHEPQDENGNVYDNLMYSFHFYAASHNDGTPIDSTMGRGYDFMTPFIKDDAEKGITCILKSLPIFVTEFGTTDASGWHNLRLDMTEKWLDVFDGDNEAHQIVSWCNWSYSAEGGECAALKWNDGKMYPLDKKILTASGEYIFNKLHEAKYNN